MIISKNTKIKQIKETVHQKFSYRIRRLNFSWGHKYDDFLTGPSSRLHIEECLNPNRISFCFLFSSKNCKDKSTVVLFDPERAEVSL